MTPTNEPSHEKTNNSQTCSETTLLVFPRGDSNDDFNNFKFITCNFEKLST